MHENGCAKRVITAATDIAVTGSYERRLSLPKHIIANITIALMADGENPIISPYNERIVIQIIYPVFFPIGKYPRTKRIPAPNREI